MWSTPQVFLRFFFPILSFVLFLFFHHICRDLSATALVAENAGLTFFGSGYTILLYGDIGAGKTTFARHFISAFLDEENASVSSPTFTLDTTYVHPLSGVKLHHMDLYRIEKEEELNVLNLPKIYENATSLIEWPDRLHNTKYMPESYVVVHLLRGSENEVCGYDH